MCQGTGVPQPITAYVISAHARGEMARRALTEQEIAAVVRNPEGRIDIRPGRAVLQSRTQAHGRVFLIRVFVDVDRDPAEVVPVYRTSKVAKYWRGGT